MDIEQARFNMVEQQIRPWDVLDLTVLDLLFTVKREEYVPAQHRALAFADLELPLGHGESMMSPKLEARLVQSLGLGREDSVLEVGTGSGYVTALLASLARHVYSVDIVAGFTESARAKLSAHGIANVTLETGDAAAGWNAHAPYDAILVTGSLPIMPQAWPRLLAPGGRLVAIVGDAPAMVARRIVREADDAYSDVGLFETCIKPLRNAPQPERFVL